MQLKKKIILVFGGNGKLGKSLVKEIIKNQGIVISVDTKFTNKSLFKLKKNLYIVNCDLLNKKFLINLKKDILKKFKKIDSLVNVITTKTDDFYFPLEKFTFSSWKKIIDTELSVSFLISQVFGSHMCSKRSGNLVFMSSIYGMVGNDHEIYKNSNLAKIYSNKKQIKNIFSNIAYSVSKGGIISLTKFLATYWAKKNVRVNCISAGGIYNEKENVTFIKNYSKKVPLNRKANINEIVDSIIFLLSSKSKYINGHNLVVDGGFTAW